MAHEITAQQYKAFLAWAKEKGLEVGTLEPTHVEPPNIRPIHAPPESPRDTYTFGIAYIDDDPNKPEVRVHGAGHSVIRVGVKPDEVPLVLADLGFDSEALPPGLGGTAPLPNTVVAGIHHEEKPKRKTGGKR